MRLIDADALIEQMEADAEHFDNAISKMMYYAAISDVKHAPTIEQEIIRCRNCKFASGDSRICMKFGHSPIGELDFCAWAERKTDE